MAGGEEKIMGRPKKEIGAAGQGQAAEITRENPRNSALPPVGRMRDLTYVPEFIDGRRVLKTEKVYRWARIDKVDMHRALGYRPCNYKDMIGDAGYFEEDVRGYIRLGDTIFMEIDRRAYEEHQAEIRERLDRWEGKEKDAFHNVGASMGVETTEESPEE